jgi:hypothetical protein
MLGPLRYHHRPFKVMSRPGRAPYRPYAPRLRRSRSDRARGESHGSAWCHAFASAAARLARWIESTADPFSWHGRAASAPHFGQGVIILISRVVNLRLQGGYTAPGTIGAPPGPIPG